MATAKSDTSFTKNKDDSDAFSWADWMIVEPDIPNLHHKAADEVDNSWIVVEPTPTDEYTGLKKSTFVVEAWHWAFGWLKQKDNAKKKEKKKNEERQPKGRDAKSKPMNIISPALDEKIVAMFEKIIERAVEETMEENIIQNEEIFQKMLTDVIETAWVELWEEEESKTDKAAEITDACSNIFDQMLNDTLEYTCDEVATEERLDKSCNMMAESMAENSGAIEETAIDALHKLANGLRGSESETVEDTDTILEKHEKTLEKVEMFYDKTTEDGIWRDGDLIKKARQYVQDIIVVSLGILDEEQRTLKKVSHEDEEKDYSKVPEADPPSGMMCLFNNRPSAGGGGDFPDNNPRNEVNEANFSQTTTTVKAKGVNVDNTLDEDITRVKDIFMQNKVESDETEEAKAVEHFPLDNASFKDEHEQKTQQSGAENIKQINKVCEVKAENEQDGIIYFDTVKNASNQEIVESGIKVLETQNVGRLRRFRNQLSRLCFWRKYRKQS